MDLNTLRSHVIGDIWNFHILQFFHYQLYPQNTTYDYLNGMDQTTQSEFSLGLPFCLIERNIFKFKYKLFYVENFLYVKCCRISVFSTRTILSTVQIDYFYGSEKDEPEKFF